MADNQNFDPQAMVSFMQNAAKTTNQNAAMRQAFQKLVATVEELAKVFEEDYEAPATVKKQRAPRGSKKAEREAKAAARQGVNATLPVFPSDEAEVAPKASGKGKASKADKPA
ncbi:hypothetical protein MUN82_10320 [Hymenobacter aerilatus]|uniref:Uncharacterized protein n=1 Tax=Hymenobacter aerilatus TaxID=2932251 RepID=A0A8T9SYZ3_9BACT|nr:hypothetical protein [Hymenobacter aerilatus]UOR07472.1 hypothetical protein MUN82_10320 [Hymenobacter aerilatus]